MGSCSVLGCKNRSDQGYLLKRFPRDPHLRKLWMEKVRTKRWSYNNYSAVCEVHFEACMWEKVRVDGKRKLKATAVPTLFPYDTEKTKQPHETGNVVQDYGVNLSSAFVKENNEDIVIEFNPSSSFPEDPLSLVRKRPEKLNDNTDYTLNMYKSSLMTHKEHVKQLEDRLKTQQSAETAILKKIFSDDQIEFIKSPNAKKWSNKTIKRALKLKFTCQDKGYDELIRQNIPLPCLKTLRTHLEHLQFESGILNEMLEYLQLKISTFTTDHHKDCIIHLEEIPVLQATIYDTTQNKRLGTVSHALVVSLCGIYAKWKQIVAYYFTGNSMNGSEYMDILGKVMCKAKDLGVKVISVTYKLRESQRFWKSTNITALRHSKIINYILIKYTPQQIDCRRIYILPDVSNSFRNIKQMFVSNKIVTIPSPLNEQYCLPSNCANFDHIQELITAQTSLNFQLMPTVAQEGLLPAHSELNILSAPANIYDISSALKVVSDECDRPEYKTTAWLIDMFERWFSLMTSRHPALALSKHVPETYEESTEFLKHFMELINQMQVGSNNIWTQCQMDILVATQSVLDIQDVLLNYNKYNMVMTSRITECCTEQLINSAISEQAILSVANFTHKLKKTYVSQYLQDVTVSGFDECNEFSNKEMQVTETIKTESEH